MRFPVAAGHDVTISVYEEKLSHGFCSNARKFLLNVSLK